MTDISPITDSLTAIMPSADPAELQRHLAVRWPSVLATTTYDTAMYAAECIYYHLQCHGIFRRVSPRYGLPSIPMYIEDATGRHYAIHRLEGRVKSLLPPHLMTYSRGIMGRIRLKAECSKRVIAEAIK